MGAAKATGIDIKKTLCHPITHHPNCGEAAKFGIRVYVC
jgi:hypothetical protein